MCLFNQCLLNAYSLQDTYKVSLCITYNAFKNLLKNLQVWKSCSNYFFLTSKIMAFLYPYWLFLAQEITPWSLTEHAHSATPLPLGASMNGAISRKGSCTPSSVLVWLLDVKLCVFGNSNKVTGAKMECSFSITPIDRWHFHTRTLWFSPTRRQIVSLHFSHELSLTCSLETDNELLLKLTEGFPQQLPTPLPCPEKQATSRIPRSLN